MMSVVWPRFAMLGNLGDSVIIGLVAMRVLRGRIVSRVLNSLVMGFVAFRVLTRWSAKTPRLIVAEEITEERWTSLHQARPKAQSAKAASNKPADYFRVASASGGGRRQGVSGVLLRPIRLVRSLVNAVF